MKSKQAGIGAASWFYSQPWVRRMELEADPIDALTTRYCEICSAEMGTMSKAAWEAAGRDCGCRPE